MKIIYGQALASVRKRLELPPKAAATGSNPVGRAISKGHDQSSVNAPSWAIHGSLDEAPGLTQRSAASAAVMRTGDLSAKDEILIDIVSDHHRYQQTDPEHHENQGEAVRSGFAGCHGARHQIRIKARSQSDQRGQKNPYAPHKWRVLLIPQ